MNNPQFSNPYERQACGHLARFVAQAENGTAACVACELAAAKKEIERMRKALTMIAGVVYGGFIFDGDTYAHSLVVEAMRVLAREGLDGAQ